MDACYTRFLHKFFDALKRTERFKNFDSENFDIMRTESVLWKHVAGETYRMMGLGGADAKWATISGEWVCLFPIAATESSRRYAIPAEVNSRPADIIVVFTPEHPQGKILGIRHNANNVFQKGYDPICPSDKIAFYQQEHDFATGRESWHKTAAHTNVQNLIWQPAPAEFSQGYRHTDVFKNVMYSI
jgi:hypothetical protein